MQQRLVVLIPAGVLVGWLGLHYAVQWAQGPRQVRAQELPPLKPTMEEYAVQPGDTFWQICATVVGEGYWWPRVWALNPEITNPNWIYPGDVIRFTAGGARDATLAADQRDVPGDEEEDAEASDAEGDVESVGGGGPGKSRINNKLRLEVVESVPGVRLGRGDGTRRVFSGLFVTPKEMAAAGVIQNAPADKLILSDGDTLFIKFPKQGTKPAVGERLMTYRSLNRVFHPISNRAWGVMTQVTGFATVTALEKEVVQARLDTIVFEVERGQRVMPLTESLTSDLAARPAQETPKIEGVVLAVDGSGAQMVGNEQFVFVDQGKKSGLERGMRLRVVEGGDPVKRESKGVPTLPIGMLLVVDVKESAAACLVVEAQREIRPGDAVRAPQ